MKTIKINMDKVLNDLSEHLIAERKKGVKFGRYVARLWCDGDITFEWKNNDYWYYADIKRYSDIADIERYVDIADANIEIDDAINNHIEGAEDNIAEAFVEAHEELKDEVNYIDKNEDKAKLIEYIESKDGIWYKDWVEEEKEFILDWLKDERLLTTNLIDELNEKKFLDMFCKYSDMKIVFE